MLLSSSLQFPGLTSSQASLCLPVLNDGCGISRWLARAIGFIYLMVSLAPSHFPLEWDSDKSRDVAGRKGG